ncbi:MAG: hypothetical protein [Bacteriophage sp.]|nr:MAG: hypothetical protein [Bacteriophage sp.]
MAIRARRKAVKSATPKTDAAIQWARDILAGSRPVCRFITQALERHFSDIEKSKSDDYPYIFDAARAEKRIKIIEGLPHTKGKWGSRNELIVLEPWQSFGEAMVFGWVKKENGRRRFREAYFEIPRKNGKSILAASVGIIMLVGDGEYGAEVYAGAGTEKQAWEVFKPAKIMLQKTPDLVKSAGIQVNAKTITVPSNGAVFQPVIGDPGDGASPSCALIDEFHEHDNSNLYDTMTTGMGARDQPLTFIITTAGWNIAGPCFAKRTEAIEMLNGTVPEETLFAYIWTIDEGDDWTKIESAYKANPNLGVSVDVEYLETRLRQAINHPRHASAYKTKHLNLWTASKEGFFNMATWDKLADRNLNLAMFKGEKSYAGLDMARKIDLNSKARLFKRIIDGKVHYYSVRPQFYAPEETINDFDNKRMAERLTAWRDAGLLQETDGAEVDYRYILEDIKDTHAENPIEMAAIDPYGAMGISHQMEDEGIPVVAINQNFTGMSAAMKELEAAILSGRFHHDGNEILTWCISNVVGKNMAGNDDVVRPVKEKPDNKIDGAVALIMAVGQAMSVEENDDGNIEDFLNTPLTM